MRYALIVEYNGSNYAGFQIQKNGPTIQEKLENALGIIFQEPIRINFSGRTDAGVHATGQVISFTTAKQISTPIGLAKSINALLPKDIAIQAVTGVQENFHPRYSCLAREYEYIIWNKPLRSVRWHQQALWLRQKLIIKELNQELKTIIGSHDFSAFTPKINQQNTYIRQVYSAMFIEDLDQKQGCASGIVRFHIIANGFLHNMIRILLGSLIEKNIKPNRPSLQQILSSHDRLMAGPTISPIGLYFRKAYYPPNQEVLLETKTPCLAMWQQ